MIESKSNDEIWKRGQGIIPEFLQNIENHVDLLQLPQNLKNFAGMKLPFHILFYVFLGKKACNYFCLMVK